MPPYHDVYVAANTRTAAEAERFLNAFAPLREQSARDCCFPEHTSEPVLVLESAAEAMQFCELHSDASQSLYFRNLEDGPAQAMLFFTPDGGLILGLSVVDDEELWYGRLKDHADSNTGYMTFETPPPSTMAEFLRIALSCSQRHS